MAAAFEFQCPIDTLAADLEGNQGVAAGFRILGIRDFHFPALAFGVFHIHPIQVARKNVAFVTSGCTADFHERIVRVVGIPGYEQELQVIEIGLDFRLQLPDFHLRHLPDFPVVFRRQDPRIFQCRHCFFVCVICIDDGCQFALFPAQFCHGLAVTQHLGAHHQFGNFIVSLFKTFQTVIHFRHLIHPFPPAGDHCYVADSCMDPNVTGCPQAV